MRNKIKGAGLIALTTILPVLNVFAEEEGDQVTKTIAEISKWLTTIGGGLAVLAIVIAGIMMVMSHENEKNVSSAKDIIKWAMIGLGVILMANVLASIVKGLVVTQ